jgi:hypothetical protein
MKVRSYNFPPNWNHPGLPLLTTRLYGEAVFRADAAFAHPEIFAKREVWHTSAGQRMMKLTL